MVHFTNFAEIQHMHELLIERTEAATRRVAELEGVVASLYVFKHTPPPSFTAPIIPFRPISLTASTPWLTSPQKKRRNLLPSLGPNPSPPPTPGDRCPYG